MKTFAGVVVWVMMTFVFLGGAGSCSAWAQQSAGGASSAEKLPPDIHPDTWSRMPRATRDDFATEEEKKAFDEVMKTYPQYSIPNGAIGPTGTRVQNPELAQIYRGLFSALHEKCGLEPKYFELSALVATRESNNEHEWTDHEPAAAKLMSPQIIEAIRNKQDPPKGLEDKEEIIIRYGREMFRQPKVSSKTFADAEKLFGRKGTLGITLVMSYYGMNAYILHAYDQHVDTVRRKRPFPDLVAADAKAR
jgi:hypothetical protein